MSLYSSLITSPDFPVVYPPSSALPSATPTTLIDSYAPPPTSDPPSEPPTTTSSTLYSPSATSTSTIDVSTVYMALTTTFTQPANCGETPRLMYHWETRLTPIFWKQGGDGTVSCFPSAFPFSTSKIVYSPGICPAAWTSACEKTDTREGLTRRIASCCPRSYACASSIPPGWDGRFGCVSSYDVPYSEAMQRWSLSANDVWVNSMYQMPVMIVPDSTISSLPVTPQSNPNNAPLNIQPSALNKGAIAGIVIGAIIGVALVVLLVVMALRARKKRYAGVQNAYSHGNEQDVKGSDAPEVLHGRSTPYSAQHYPEPAELPEAERTFEMRGMEPVPEVRRG